jgi:osmotically-inducible protein OsmY
MVWGRIYPTVPIAAGIGAATGGACALIAVSIVLMMKRRNIDRELTLAAGGARREAGLPRSISVHVRARRLTVEGEVDDPSVLREADMAFKRLPGIEHVENKIQVVSPIGHPNPEEVRRSIEESLRRHSEVEAHGIQVVIHRSRVILEGKVKSWADASEAERIAWDMPGIQEVENRLDVLA